jgi:integrase
MPDLPKYIQKRKQGYYAVLEIPKALRDHFGKPRFVESLQTRDLKLAERRVPILVSKWKASIEKARGVSSPAASVLWEAIEWRKIIENEEDDDARMALEDALSHRLDALEVKHGPSIAMEVGGIASGDSIPLALNIEGWLPTIAHLNDKTLDAHKKAVEAFCAHFKTTKGIDKVRLKEYLGKLRSERDLSDQTIAKLLSFFRSFVGYLDETHSTALLPLFSAKTLGSKTASGAKTAKQRSWLAFTPEDVSKLYAAASASKKAQDKILADLIALGAYTGCRIEELGQIKKDHVKAESIQIEDSKTAAGIREIPIHPVIAPIVSRLLEASKDGFLIEATAATYNKRTNALGTRFGRLKTSLGYGERHVFHSIRKTVVSQLEQAGINENITADIVGHEKPRITYGLYSSGTSLKQKAEALSQVTYGGSLGNPA